MKITKELFETVQHVAHTALRRRSLGMWLARQPTAGRRLGCYGNQRGCLHQRQITAAKVSITNTLVKESGQGHEITKQCGQG